MPRPHLLFSRVASLFCFMPQLKLYLLSGPHPSLLLRDPLQGTRSLSLSALIRICNNLVNSFANLVIIYLVFSHMLHGPESRFYLTGSPAPSIVARPSKGSINIC